jgi:hypothetical protein
MYSNTKMTVNENFLRLSWLNLRQFALTYYGLDRPVQPGPGTYQACYAVGAWPFLAVKGQRNGVDHPPQFNDAIKERVGLYLYSPLCLFAGYRAKFTFTFYFGLDGMNKKRQEA